MLNASAALCGRVMDGEGNRCELADDIAEPLQFPTQPALADVLAIVRQIHHEGMV